MECFRLHGAADGYYIASWSVSRGSDELSKQTRNIERWWSWWNSSPAHKGMQHQITPGLCMIFNQSLCTGQIPRELKSADIQCNIHPQKECKGGYRKFSVHLAPVHCEQSSGATGFRSPFNHLKKVITHLKHGFLRNYSCVTQLLSVLHEIGEYYTRTCRQILFTWTLQRLLILPTTTSFSPSWGHTVPWFKNCLREKVQCVVVDGTASQRVPVTGRSDCAYHIHSFTSYYLFHFC